MTNTSLPLGWTTNWIPAKPKAHLGRRQQKWINKSPNDAYENNNAAFYIRDIWTPSASLEISAALRADKIDVKFTDQNRQFDKTMLAPRFHVRYDHGFNLTSRLSFGQGYLCHCSSLNPSMALLTKALQSMLIS